MSHICRYKLWPGSFGFRLENRILKFLSGHPFRLSQQFRSRPRFRFALRQRLKDLRILIILTTYFSEYPTLICAVEAFLNSYNNRLVA